MSQEMTTFYHNTALQPSSVSVPSPKSIGSLIGIVLLLSQHHSGRISGSKMGFRLPRAKE